MLAMANILSMTQCSVGGKTVEILSHLAISDDRSTQSVPPLALLVKVLLKL